ncbi:hypothetical protein K9N08_01510 [Candidatus Gracilibacteria bacterium]|nr:hypothetical protein [Candidatus Gracilibacteria bacterium]MCF7856218.1 hypothetical protein [Candidatus Gracilibacteria bacterium]MCF7896717.1 hypothetical protein [Candidatus Gracilibacteria bacterium]
MKKFLFSLLALNQIFGIALAENTVTGPTPAENIFELAGEMEAPTSQPIQFFLGDAREQTEGNLDAEFLYQALVNQLNANFAVAEDFVILVVGLIVFIAVFFGIVTVLQYFYFRKQSEMELHKFKHLNIHNFEELKKECEIRENNLQSIVDQQQRVLEELKETIAPKINQ